MTHPADQDVPVSFPLVDEHSLAEALSGPGRVLLDFWQESCAPCRALEPRLERFTADHPGAFRPYRIDVDSQLALTRRLQVMSIPTLVLLQDGIEILRLDGLIRDSDLHRLLTTTAEGAGS